MFPIVPAGDVYRDVVASGGQVDSGFIPFWLGLVTATGLVPPDVSTVSPDDALLTLLQHAQGALDFQVPTVADAVAGGDAAYDGPFYRLRSPARGGRPGRGADLRRRRRVRPVPAGEPMLYEALRRNGVPTRFLMGPWNHIQAATAPGLPSGKVPTLDALALRWFDRYVRGADDRSLLDDVRPVTYFEIGSGRWRTASRWMPRSVHAETYHLDGRAAPGAPGCCAPARCEHRATPPSTRSLSPACARAARPSGPRASQRSRGARPTTSSTTSWGTAWETRPLRQAVHLMGPVNARLFVHTTARDGMLSVAVEDVAPDGSVDRLTGGWQVLSHRATTPGRALRRDGEVLQPWHPFSRDAQLEVEPGKVMRVDVEVFPTGAVLRKGHRLRVTVQAYDTPHLTATVPQTVDGTGGVITVHHTPWLRSRLVLPVRG